MAVSAADLTLDALHLGLVAQSAFYDLSLREERRRSARALARLFHGLQAEIRPDIFAEVGAKDGATSLRVKRSLPEARVVAFEANPYNFKRFSSELSHAKAGVEYLHSAIGDRDGQATFRIQRAIAGAAADPVSGRNSLLARVRDDVEYEEVSVPATSLDKFFGATLHKRFSLWIDVEGASGLVLSGADRLLRRVESLIVEVEQKKFWDGQWLAPQVVRFLVERELVPVARDFEYKSQYNVVFISRARLYESAVQNHLEGFIHQALKHRPA